MIHVEDWKITIPSFNIFPIIPLTFDNLYWETYSPIVNKLVAFVKEIISKLEREIREKKMEKMAENKRKLEKEEAERLEAQKKQEELCLWKKKNRITYSITCTQLT